jgi:F-box protein 9
VNIIIYVMSPNTAASASLDHSREHLRLFSSDSPEEGGSDPIIQCVIEEKSSGQEWQLTWPIWHLLPHVERKRIASDYGMSVGQFEEFASLQEAMGHSLPTCKAAMGVNHPTSSDSLTHKAPRAVFIKEDQAEGGGNDISPSPLLPSTLESNAKTYDCMILIDNETNRTKKTTNSNTTQSSLLLTMIPEDLIHKILAFLTVDTYGVCRRVCSLLEQMTTKEVSYKIRCERIYSNQTRSRGVMRMERWNYSYRNMWRNRPRVLTGGGLYLLKYSHIKPIQRDMWTEVP